MNLTSSKAKTLNGRITVRVSVQNSLPMFLIVATHLFTTPNILFNSFVWRIGFIKEFIGMIAVIRISDTQ